MTRPALPLPDGTQTVGEVLISIVRTVVPGIVGTVIAWLASRGLDLTAYGNAVNIYLVPAALLGYYSLVRLAERHWPAAGFLLGWRAVPKYIDQSGQPVAAPAVEPEPRGFFDPADGS